MNTAQNDYAPKLACRALSDEAQMLAQATLAALAKDNAWTALDFEALLGQAGVSKADVYPEYCEVSDLEALLLAYLDHTMISEAQDNAQDYAQLSTKERLFELLMTRFDVMQAYRAGYIAFFDAKLWPAGTNIDALLRTRTAMKTCLTLAGLGAEGLRFEIKAKALMVTYLLCLRQWYQEEHLDMAGLMRYLDQALERLEQMAQRVPGLAQTRAS